MTHDGGSRLTHGSTAYLASHLPVLDLATWTVGSVEDAADRLRVGLGFDPLLASVDRERVAAAYSSDRLLRLDGEPVDGFAPLSGFFSASDAWVRTHANYPHHAERLRRMLALGPDAGRDEVASAIATRSAGELEGAADAIGALVVRVRSSDEWSNGEQSGFLGREPLVRRSVDAQDLADGGDADPRAVERRSLADPVGPLRGVRVLDLTRVIAGPVATRTLALLGADVLRVDTPTLPEIPWQHLDTGQGKRTVSIDGTTRSGRALLQVLLDGADVLVTGYRPGALDRLRLVRPPRLVEASVDAWGGSGPWRGRRGFDSLVQAASGIAVIDGSLDRPGALPAQALDHTSGYLLAAAIIDALAQQIEAPGAHRVAVSLARVSAHLLAADRTELAPLPITPSVAATVTHRVRGTEVTTARPALSGYDDYPFPAHLLGSGAPVWSV